MNNKDNIDYMTTTVNGFGTCLAGKKYLTPDEVGELLTIPEFQKVIGQLPIETDADLLNFAIATESLCAVWLPFIPLQTFIFYEPRTKWYQSDGYIPLFYPAGEGKVDWSHVKSSWSFYISYGFVIALSVMVFMFDML